MKTYGTTKYIHKEENSIILRRIKSHGNQGQGKSINKEKYFIYLPIE